MHVKGRKFISLQMVMFELRNTVGNPYVHIFGVGLPIVLALLITRIVESEMEGNMAASVSAACTSVYLGMGALIPMAILLMGYAVSYAGELSKGIPERMQLFGITGSMSLCNRAIAEMFFILIAFLVFFGSGCMLSDIEKPVAAGLWAYILCMAALSFICLMLAHGIACICRNFGKTYCASMILYFGFMILGGMMGIQYDALPNWGQAMAKLLPVMYINRDFYKIWVGKDYNCMPMFQSFLFLGAVSFILFFISGRRPAGKACRREPA